MERRGGGGGEVSNTRGLILRGTRMDTHGTGGGVSDDVRECAWREGGGGDRAGHHKGRAANVPASNSKG